MRNTRRTFAPAFKAKVALSALRAQETVSELAQKHKLHVNQIYKWKRELVENAQTVFARPGRDCASSREEALLKKVGELTLERDVFCMAARSLPQRVRREMVEPEAKISIQKQCALLGISRSAYYRKPAETSAEELELMSRIKQIHLDYPLYGSRRVASELSEHGPVVNRKRVQRLMRLMGIAGIGPKPGTVEPASEHRVIDMDSGHDMTSR